MQIGSIANEVVSLGVTAVGGQLDGVEFRLPHGTFTPLHCAPWHAEPFDDAIPPMLQMLRGDFFCAPFGDSDVLADEQRPHGAPANGTWECVKAEATRLDLRLPTSVSGAEVHKTVRLHPGHAVVYQEHRLVGGSGRIPIGHHAMLRANEPLRLGFSRWQWGGTPPPTLEPDPQLGRSLLLYPQQFATLSEVRRSDGGTADLTTYPWDAKHEDLVMLVDGMEEALAWSTATARDAGWVWFSLRDPRVLRNTVLWMSNGGRYYPPFSRRHVQVLGIEHTTSYFHLGHRASIDGNELSQEGLPTAVELDPEQPLVVRYVQGLTATPAGFDRVVRVERNGEGITLIDANGRQADAVVDIDSALLDGT